MGNAILFALRAGGVETDASKLRARVRYAGGAVEFYRALSTLADTGAVSLRAGGARVALREAL